MNSDKKTFRLYLLDPDSRSVSQPEYSQVVTRPDFPVSDGVFDVAMASRSPVLIDLEEHERSTGLPPYLKINYDLGVREAVMIALRKYGENFGVLGLFADTRNAFNDHNLRIIRGISSQLSVAVANILANEEKGQNRNEIATLLSISNDIASIRDKTDLLQVVQGKLKTLFKFNDSAVVIFNGDRSTYRVFLNDCEHPRAKHPNFERILDFDYPTDDGIHDLALNSDGAVAIDISKLDLEKPNLKFIYETGLREIAAVKLRDSDRVFGIMTLLSETTNAFSDADLRLLFGISNQISIAIANVLANEKIERQLEEINRYKQQLEIEKQYLQTEVHVAYNYGEIVGDGPEMQKVFRLMSQVPPPKARS
jgi:GAF domain-containing protein